MEKKALFGFKFRKDEKEKGTKFLLVFVIIYSLLYFGFNFIVPLEMFEFFVASIVMSLLGIMGVKGSIVLQEPVLILLESSLEIQISYLCTGLMEIFIVIGAVLASLGIEMRKRLIGIVAGVVFAFVFNIFRIVVTILFAVSNPAPGVLEFTHDILFRVTLFVVIAGFYIVWFLWATNQLENAKKDIANVFRKK
ncbi:MAG: exosortase/archaeosortase family protein [Candidatus Diapherotrites archaeon]